MAYYIYILYSVSSDIYYVGYSDNPEKRLYQHNNPVRMKFTSKHLPWELKCSFEVSENRGNAMKAEKYIKNKKSRKYLEKLIIDVEERQHIAQFG